MTATMVFWLLLNSFPGLAVAEQQRGGFVLGPQDKIAVFAVEWRPAQAQMFEWKPINRQYQIDEAGTISVPLVGKFKAAGQTTQDLAVALGRRLKKKLGLAVSPNVSVDIVATRPFYVTGAVAKPGEYTFRPGIDVLQAVALAGGFPVPVAATASEIVAIKRVIADASVSLQSLRARKARLTAQLNDTDLVFPLQQSRNSDPKVRLLLEQERRIFELQRGTLRSQVEKFSQLKDFLEQQVEFLESQIKVNMHQLDLVNTQKAAFDRLRERGLTNSQNIFEIARLASEQNEKLLRLRADLSKARQEFSNTDSAVAELVSRNKSVVILELQETQEKIDKAISARNEAQLQLKFRQNLIGPNARGLDAGGRTDWPRRATFRIVRRVATAATSFDASETERLQPGDTLVVEQGEGAQARDLATAALASIVLE